MELEKYLGKKVQVGLSNSFAYIGILKECKKNCVYLRDFKDELVIISRRCIEVIKEVKENSIHTE